MEVIPAAAPASSSISCTHRCFYKTDKPSTVPVLRFKNHSSCDSSYRGITNFPVRLQVSALETVEIAPNHELFDKISTSDTFGWNTLIQKHIDHGNFHAAFTVYEQMLIRGILPDRHTVPRIIAASRLSGSLIFGKQVHGQSFKFGLSSNSFVVTALMEFYGFLEGAESARWVFEKTSQESTYNVIACTLLCRFYAMGGKPLIALELFNNMLESGTADIDAVSLATAIGACGLIKSLKEGKNIHRIARVHGLASNILVSNSLLKMYLDCASLNDARKVFDKMSTKDAISWTEMLRGHVKKGGFGEGLKLFREMITNGIKPDPLAISSILPACARMAVRKQGKEIHAHLLRNGIDMNLTVQNALVDMYIKSGSIEYASIIYSRMNCRDVISWTIMLLGCSLHGQIDLAISILHDIDHNSGSEIDQNLYDAVLSACSTARLVDMGRRFFSRITSPNLSQNTLMVLILARSALFDEAMSFIRERNLSRHPEVLKALLDGCKVHNNIYMGKQVMEQLCEFEPLNAENYVLLQNWYAQNRNWDKMERTRETMNDMGLKPKKGYSWIEYRNKVHVFGTEDLSHPQSDRIYQELQHLMKKKVEEVSNFGFHDVDEERGCNPIGHSELLAVSFGLISTEAGSTIRVTKNLHVCQNCHETVMMISEIVNREIIIKDQSCFHHFKNGRCSCHNFQSQVFP
ncbi:putative pentatricopeptide repeat-containing protein At3g23330 [Impatiens glandulifera]|uniref:putative pentatricopeptide repeat-containing protein At3g23330 n=1 Tax=Impatiens glandulifera TaxID=253017 RepID=UPI001FB0FBE7|nr:putative pentatricopeptide repeat-containing protein At3g23330 [Impatiens glandulifera]